MFNIIKGKKGVLAGVALLIVAGGVFIFLRSGAAGGGWGLLEPAGQAWRAAFGGSGGEELAVELPLRSSSTIDIVSGPMETVLKAGTSWPPLLKEAAVGASPVPTTSSTSTSAPVLAPPQWCDFSATARGDAPVILNEIAWMGSVSSPDDEWLELANVSSREIDAGGWQVLNKKGSVRIILGATSTIARSGFLVLHRNKDYSGALANTGEWLKVFDADCRVVYELDASSKWPAGKNDTKQTAERDADSSGWHTSLDPGGSPGAENSVPQVAPPQTSGNDAPEPELEPEPEENPPPENSSSTAPAATSTPPITVTSTLDVATSTDTNDTNQVSHLVIAAVRITGGPGATDEDYIEIYNPTSQDVDISGWKLRKRAKTGTESSIKVFGDGSTIAAGGRFMWANSANDFAATVGATASSTQTLASDNSAALFDAGGALIDAVAWGADHADPFVEGQPYPANPEAGQVLTRKADTDDNSADFHVL